jgi:hypothetical protein
VVPKVLNELESDEVCDGSIGDLYILSGLGQEFGSLVRLFGEFFLEKNGKMLLLLL